jgi:hypothetical protein
VAKAKKLSRPIFPKIFLLFVITFTIFIVGFTLGALYYQNLFSAYTHKVNQKMIGHTIHVPSKKEISQTWKVYQDPASGLKIRYPEDWTQTTSTNFLRIVHSATGKNNYSLQMNFMNRPYNGATIPVLKTQYIKQKQQDGMQLFAACDCEIAKMKGFQVNGYFLDQNYQTASYETDFVLIDQQKKREYEFVFTHAPKQVYVDDLIGSIISSISY